MESFDPVNTYFYYNTFRKVDFIMKWHPDLVIKADDIFGPKFKKFHGEIEAFNYGNTKPFEARLETLRRRQKAWDEGMCKAWGHHYTEGEKAKWIWDKELFKDIRESDLWEYILKLQHDTARTDI